MRGKATIFQSHLGNTRITPAYAGKSTETIMVCKKCWDHPRLCGEKYRNNHGMQEMLGSPPPMRGKAYKMWAHLEVIRITPAYAGKSYREKFTHMIRKDHPRLCGEKQHATAVADAVGGSPPPMRGKVPAVVELNLPIGITPAYAGKSRAAPADG